MRKKISRMWKDIRARGHHRKIEPLQTEPNSNTGKIENPRQK
jgi:hypothetical protein